MNHRFPILIVDDDRISRKFLEKTIRKAGNEVFSVGNGKKALEIMSEKFFPIVLTDWMMPEMDGLELCKAIRKNSDASSPYVFIILITVRDSQDDIITGLEAGADDYLTKPFNFAELIARINTGKRILELESSLKRANEDLNALSITDPLTGFYNRRSMTARFLHEIKQARRYNRPHFVILCEIDHFKKVNDSYGHQVGNLVLQELSAYIRESIRLNVDWVTRYGAEEFLIVLPETNINDAISPLERLREKLRLGGIKSQGTKIVVTASFGVTGFDPDTADDKISADAMIKMADTYLYQAKQAGGNMIKAGGL